MILASFAQQVPAYGIGVRRFGAFGAASEAVRALQTALVKLGGIVKDPILKVTVDGLTGPQTAAAVNRAFMAHIAAAPASLKSGLITPAMVLSAAVSFTQFVNGEIARRGAVAPPPSAPIAVAAPRAVVIALQNRLNQLGQLVQDSSLKVAADGIVGPLTATAASRALSRYVSNPPAGLRGTLSVAQVNVNASAISLLVAQEISRRAPAPPPPAPPMATQEQPIRPPPTAVAPPPSEVVGEETEYIPPPPPPPAAAPAPPPPAETFMPTALAPVAPAPLPSVVAVEEKKFPWIWVIGGGSAVVLVVAGILVFGGGKRKRR